MVHDDSVPETNKDYAIGLGRAFGGAVIFAIPLLMTMEMWWLGFSMEPVRLLLFMSINFAILIGLSYFAGFEKTFSWKEDAMDAFAAFGVGVLTSAAMLALLAVITLDMTWNEIVGKVALQSVPASIGAMLGRKQLGGGQDIQAEEERKAEAGYGGELFLMLAGALFLAFNVAPTEEMILIAYQMSPWHTLALGALSIILLHVLVYTVGFSGQESRLEGGTFLSTFFHFTLAGYGIALLISFYVLWTFGRTEGVAPTEIANMVVVLGFPASLGAATARLVI
ncbi:TIGR02587 family membrane protein [Microvirga sp. VF16]|uniref:TIGR02587 family membrane protein n=1 Tax=Microvirga sp. VF16 TaxID=2807101 RepID=UPI00193E24BF|nr:TIGR02587 family membrane protein [Microvirga sp. VF16]QRM30254.1 TIGR02587 family membrane protein [Microvirga sp. VF16]